MDFSEVLDLETKYELHQSFKIVEENVKIKRINRLFNVNGSYQYKTPEYSDRFLTWNTSGNVIHITELSTKYDLLGNYIQITFEKGIVLDMHVFETSDYVEFLLSGSLTVVRFSLHHPSKLRLPVNDSYQHSIFYDVSNLNESKYLITPYFDADTITAVSSCLDYQTKEAHFSYALSSGNIYCVVIPNSGFIESMYHYEITESSFISKIFSGFIPKPKNNTPVDAAILDMDYICVNDKLLITSISKDNKIRVWNLKDRYCCIAEDLLMPSMQTNNCRRSPSTINYNSLISNHRIKSFYHNKSLYDCNDTVLVYFNVKLGSENLKNWMVIKINDSAPKEEQFQIYYNMAFDDIDKSLDLIDFEIDYNMKLNNSLGVWNLMSGDVEGDKKLYRLSWLQFINDNSENILCRLYNISQKQSLDIGNSENFQDSILDSIFIPGHVSLTSISNVLSRVLDNNEMLFNSIQSINDLRKQLLMYVEQRIDHEVQLSMVDEDNINEITKKIWVSVYQEILSEHIDLMRPLCLINVVGTIGINRAISISLLRHSNGLENIFLEKENNQILIKHFGESAPSVSYLINYLFTCIKEFKNSELWTQVRIKLFNLEYSPTDTLTDINKLCPPVPNIIQNRLESFPDIIEKMIELLELFEMNECNFDEDNYKINCKLSVFGISLLHYTLDQTIEDRTVIAVVLLSMLKPRMMNSPIQNILKNYYDRLSCLIKSLISIHWLLNLRKSSVSYLSDSQKTILSSLQLLENRIHDNKNCDIISLKVLRSLQLNMELSPNAAHNWQYQMNEEILAILPFLNPNSENFALLEIAKYFLTYNLPLDLIDYLQYLNKSNPDQWWKGDFNIVNFLLGISYLIMNKPWKSIEYFTDSLMKDDVNSSLLPSIFFNDCDFDTVHQMKLFLILKYLEILDKICIEEPCIIKLAEIGLEYIDSLGDGNDFIKTKATLYIILFSNNCDLERFDEAYKAIVNNPDREQQKDCLRQFVITLCDAKCLKKLINYDYGILRDEFINIVSNRARSSDLTDEKQCIYYDLLYIYHMKSVSTIKNPLEAKRNTIMSMLEVALRLENELFSLNQVSNRSEYIMLMDKPIIIKQLQRQLSAYLKCISVMQTMPENEALFVLPYLLAQHLVYDDKSILKSLSNEMDVDHQEESSSTKVNRIVITGKQIKQQYYLLKCRMRLLTESGIDQSLIRAGKLSPQLTLTSLLNNGLYWDACRLSEEFQLDFEPIIHFIASRCIQIHHNSTGDLSIMKEKENIIDTLEEMNLNKDFASIGSIRTLIWILLQEFLKKFNNKQLWLTACRTLLNGNIEQLPSWITSTIVDEYKCGNDLIKLFLQRGLFYQTINLIIHLLDVKIDEVSEQQKLSSRIDFINSNVKQSYLTWLHLPIIFKVLDILRKMKHDTKQSIFETYSNQIEEKLKLIVSLRPLENQMQMAIE